MKSLIRIAVLLGLCSALTFAHTVTLRWKASTSSGVSSYNVYRATTSGGSYTKLTSVTGLMYTDGTTVDGQMYYYRATAVNTAGRESGKSGQVSVVIISASQSTTVSVITTGP